MQPLLALRRFSLEVPGAAAIGSDQVEATAPCLVLHGNWSALFDVLSGHAAYRGELRIVGEAPRVLLRTGKLATSLARVPLPEKQSAGRLLEYRLMARRPELGKAQLREQVLESLRRCRLQRIAARRVKTLSELEQRVLRLALADVVKPEILAVEDPYLDLGEPECEVITSALATISQDRGLILSVLRGLPEPAPAFAAARVEWGLERGEVRPLSREHAPGRSWYVTTLSAINELAAELGKAGAEVRGPLPLGHEHPVVRLGAVRQGGALRVCLPESESPLLVYKAAAACDAVVIELIPAV